MQSVEQRDEVEMLSLMLLIRRFEERASQQYQAQKIGGFCHLYIGQEAVVAGAINQGSFHEALNLAALFKLPIVFICENNLFAMGTSVKRSTSLKQIVDRAEGYDIPGEIVDGMNFREVRDKIAEIVNSIRKEPHPAFLEVRTYRYRGHSMSDPASYRTKQELEK